MERRRSDCSIRIVMYSLSDLMFDSFQDAFEDKGSFALTGNMLSHEEFPFDLDFSLSRKFKMGC